MLSKPREIVVDIDSSGSMYLSGHPTSLMELQRLLRIAVASNPTNQTVVFRADRSTSFQPVVSVMDLCNKSGVSDYSVTTQEGPQP